MSLSEQINKDLINALKSKEELKVSTLRMLKSALKNKEIENSKELSDSETTEVISKQIKQRRDSIDQYLKANRDELAQKEKKEVSVLEKYLPEQLSEYEIEKIIKKTILETAASGPKDMGKVMSKVMPQLKDKADGTLISKIVRGKLNQ